MSVNQGKTKIVHYRNPSVQRCDCVFKLGDSVLEVVDRYKYLGLILSEHLDYNIMVNMVAGSANRALGLLIAKCKVNGGMPYDCFTKLYDALVLSIITYGSAIWGFKEYNCINNVHNRACRYFLGVGKYTPNAAVHGDMGWKLPIQRQWFTVCRQWCRFVNMDASRINKIIFLWCVDKANNKKRNWVYHFHNYLCSINLQYICHTNTNFNVKCVLNNFDSAMSRVNEQSWYESVNQYAGPSGHGRNKLRTYKLFKSEFKPEPYVTMIMARSNRSALARFRCGVAPIRIETGRYERNVVPACERTCFNCVNDVEDEFHVLMRCALYDDLRDDLFVRANAVNVSFNDLNDNDKFVYLLNDCNIVNFSASILHRMLIRRRILFQ